MSKAPAFRSALVAGLGLVGGSIARDLVARGVKVIGYDRDVETLKSAEAEGIVPDRGSPEATDVIILAMPIAETLWLLDNVASKFTKALLVTDVCSTKASVVNAAEKAGIGSKFVGSHPVAGDHRSGWTASRRGLFKGARTYVCPAPSSDASAIALAEALWKFVGAKPERIEAQTHDREVALISHLPHVVSSALAATLAEANVPRERLGPGGRDVTRLAGADADLWTGIVVDNADAIVPALDAFQRRLERFKKSLYARDSTALRAHFSDSRDWFDREPSRDSLGGGDV